jgi:diguanylate cyclase (GGDEF)-like protein
MDAATHTHHPPAGSDVPTGLLAVQQARLRKVLSTILVVLLGMSLMYGLVGTYRTAISLLIASVLLVPSFVFNRHQRVHLAADWMLWALTIAIGILAINGQGLRDSALLGYPGLLVFAIMLWRNRTMLGLLSGQVLMVCLVWWLDASGLYTSKVAPAAATQIIDIAAVVGLTAFASWLIASDQRKYLHALAQENTRVLQTLEKLEYSIRHDVLTGLPNRKLASEALENLCNPSSPRQCPAAVMLINLDYFKSINESLGTRTGDEFLLTLARRLSATLLDNEQLFRTGSDEFLVIRSEVSDDGIAAKRATDWLTHIASPIRLSGVDISITASIGLIMFPADGNTTKELLMRADMAMQRAKEAGRNTVCRFDGIKGQEVDHLNMLADMRRGLQEGQFELHYQPKFDLHTQALCGAEALLRWKHSIRGNVPPVTFIPLAEKSGLIVELGSWVIHSACQQMQQWRQAGLDVPPVAVNVSMVQFRKGDLKDVVYGALQATDLPGHLLELELTESLLSDSHAVVQTTLEHIRRMGVSLAIDDFGTGYSNLGYLKQFEIQTLKIDQSFVRKLGTVQHDQAIVKAIVNIAAQLGLKAVAEGVESTDVADTLRQLGCHTGQGYLWSPALPADAFAQRFLTPGAQHQTGAGT